MLCDLDELNVALAEMRVARDRIARQLPEGCVVDTPEQTALLPQLNELFLKASRLTFDLRSLLDSQQVQRPIVVDITPERRW
ncbi:hypothetical protein [Sphingomonas parapaucimobilis]|uniref:Uncharacterized protein n=1 Tax=Sphingomonas parapaucimobilis NBRC 15100 TaxID=1219049 RepID=A0A0A1W6J7_9SPHN|nr:hypothetical protein [Sphingomonas parapaucimobilis]GAM00534.1 hypothetical protein SP5_034_01080 [Sphingomonas parapaucimobilis NBRC 15100]